MGMSSLQKKGSVKIEPWKKGDTNRSHRKVWIWVKDQRYWRNRCWARRQSPGCQARRCAWIRSQGTALQRRSLEPLKGRAEVRGPGISDWEKLRTLRRQ